jgi:hypothetical protein
MQPKLVMMECPLCKMHFYFEEMSMPTSFTTDCNVCGGLLIYNEGELKDFHKHMNSKDSRWPIDGKDTGYVKI